MRTARTFFPWDERALRSSLEAMEDGLFTHLGLDMKPNCRIRSEGFGGCVYCLAAPAAPYKPRLSSDQIRETLDRTAGYGIKWLTICGQGEPFDDRNIKLALMHAKQVGIKTCVFTNGLSISRPLANGM